MMEIFEEFSSYFKAAEFLLAKDQETCKAPPRLRPTSLLRALGTPLLLIYGRAIIGALQRSIAPNDKAPLINCPCSGLS